MVAIEKLIGQSIPRAEGDYEVHAEAGDATDRPREQRGRERSRGGRGKPQRGRDRERSHEPREARPSAEARPAPEARPAREPRPPREARPSPEPRHGSRPQANASHVPSIGRPEPRRQREADTEPGDHSHLPAFLLRPVRSPAGA
ncbi:hypothetical protein ACVJA9_005742 [Bradyrhizobium diazoefficiens]